MNQKLVLVNRADDYIIVQSKEDVYHDTLENFATDSGTAIPDNIQYLDRNWDTGTSLFNDDENGVSADAEEWALGILAKAKDLVDAQYLRMNPPEPPEPEPTEEEKALKALQKKIQDAQVYLYQTDYRILKFMDKQIESNADLKAAFEAEYPDTLAKRQEARDTINSTEVQLMSLSSAEEA